ncbi:hypothetical protein V490_03135 [Pseudogymnoascus sp. VKM F-3557]|nr:hypothetical protein V490_03135 [Pseudogymnoascus sp. VKM F-3557]
MVYSSEGFTMAITHTPKASAVAASKTLVDYVQFDEWTTKDTFSDAPYYEEHYKVSASYAMGVVFFKLILALYKPNKRQIEKLMEEVPSFFSSNDKVRSGCYSYGHGIVYEGCWVTYDDKDMRGSSKLDLPSGKSFIKLFEDETFRWWFMKVLDGGYKEYDFDTLPRDVLISLTSPNSPGSLASANPSVLRPSLGLPIPNNQTAAPSQQGAAKSKLKDPPTVDNKAAGSRSTRRGCFTTKKLLSARSSQVETRAMAGARAKVTSTRSNQAEAPARQGVALSTSLASTDSSASLASENLVEPKVYADSLTSNNNQAVTKKASAPTENKPSLDLSSKQSTAIGKGGDATLAQDGSQSAGHAAVKSFAATLPTDKATTSTKRQNALPITDSLNKRTKTSPSYQHQDVIDLSSDNDEQVKRNPGNSQSAHNATQDNKHDQNDPGLLEQNQRLSEENASLNLSESRAVNKLTEALGKIEKLTQDNTPLKLSEMRAVNRANEALGKLRAANRANEELGGNDDLMGQMEELLKENARLQVRLAERGDETVDVDKDVAGRVKNEGSAQRVKEEGQTGQREK